MAVATCRSAWYAGSYSSSQHALSTLTSQTELQQMHCCAGRRSPVRAAHKSGVVPLPLDQIFIGRFSGNSHCQLLHVSSNTSKTCMQI